MSGHSKWATIKHAKGVADAKRGKLFSMLSKTISLAVRESGSDDPVFNPKLRMMIDKAKAANMSKDKIKNAIDKGAGRIEGVNYEKTSYEGFGPHKVAFITNCVTDNKNRTNAEFKKLVSKNSGIIGSQGSVAYFFDKKGLIEIELDDSQNPEEEELKLIDFGADDIFIDGDHISMYVQATETHNIMEELKKSGYNVVEGDVMMVPNTWVELDEKSYQTFEKFYETIEQYDDVEKIFHNAKKIK